MRLLEGNVKLNRKFHLLGHEHGEKQQLEFLLNASSQIIPSDDGIVADGIFNIKPQFDDTGNPLDKKGLEQTVNNLNFLMVRLNALGQEYEPTVRELALLRWEYIFARSNTDYSQDADLIATFFERRGKPQYIKPIFQRMAEHAVDYDFLAEKLLESEAFKRYLPEQEIQVYRFRASLRALVKDEEYKREKAASELYDKGFDLVACDFNRWYAYEKDWKIRSGEKPYKEKSKDRTWLAGFIAKKRVEKGEVEDILPVLLENQDEEENVELEEGSTETIELLANEVKKKIVKEETPYFVRAVVPLVDDYQKLVINFSNTVHHKVWYYLWGGDFIRLAYQLKGANPNGKTRKGLNYCRWVLLHDEHSRNLDQILAQDAYAMIIAGDILVGDLDTAKRDFNDESLKKYKHDGKVKAAINLAWQMWQNPGESDEVSPEDYQAPADYCLAITREFGQFLRDMPSAKPYFELLESKDKLSSDAELILERITDLEIIKQVYIRTGQESKLKDRFLGILQKTYENDAEFTTIISEMRGVLSVLENPVFREYVDDAAIGDKLTELTQGVLERKNEYRPDEQDIGTSKLVLKQYSHPVFRPFLAGRVDVQALVTRMIDDVVERRDALLTRELSLLHNGEIAFGQNMEIIEAYYLADMYREVVPQERMQNLVAYLIAVGCDLSVSGGFDTTTVFLNLLGTQERKDYEPPEYFPKREEGEEKDKLQLVVNIYEREKRLGGIDPKKVATAVGNVIYRGTHVQPKRFYPGVDTMMALLNSPIAEVLPATGALANAIKEYRILNEFVAQKTK